MSTYINHYQQVGGQGGKTVECTHAWAEFTAKRVAWLYGDQDRSAAQAVDVARFAGLGQKAVAA